MEVGDVFFSVESFPAYGELSGRSKEENRAGERVAVDSRKRNAADFALWKVSALADGEQVASGCESTGVKLGSLFLLR